MSKFPKKESDISTLAYTMLLGYIAHLGDFPNVLPFDLLNAFKSYKAAKNAQIQAKSVVRLATERKNAKLNSLYQTMKGCLKKSQVDVADEPDKLQYIGWGPKAPPSPADPPGQPRNLETLTQGPSEVSLDWKPPAHGSGGPVRTYVIEQRNQPQGGGDFSNWQPVGTALETEATLTDQQRGIQLEYRVKAINTGGESVPSNTVVVVL